MLLYFCSLFNVVFAFSAFGEFAAPKEVGGKTESQNSIGGFNFAKPEVSSNKGVTSSTSTTSSSSLFVFGGTPSVPVNPGPLGGFGVKPLESSSDALGATGKRGRDGNIFQIQSLKSYS